MGEGPRQLRPKKEFALQVLESGPSLYVHLDPRRPGVRVPKSFANQPQLILQVGLNMAIPIPDLKIDDEGLSCTLSFNRTPFFCRLPWAAVYALIRDERHGMVWPDDVPPEVAVQMQRAQPKAAPKKPRGKLTAVDDDARPERARPRAAVDRPKLRREDATKPDGVTGIGGDSPRREKRSLEAVAPPKARPPAVAEEPPPSEGEPSPSPGPGSKRRELPPYLRVIK